MTEQHWRLLADAIRQRRIILSFAQEDLKSHGGPSGSTVQAIEQQKRRNFSERTFTELEQALQWPPGTCKRILAGLPHSESASRPASRLDAATFDVWSCTVSELAAAVERVHRLIRLDQLTSADPTDLALFGVATANMLAGHAGGRA